LPTGIFSGLMKFSAETLNLQQCNNATM